MANENRISVVITADPTGAVTGIRMVGDETEKLTGRTQSLSQRLKSHWAEVSVGIYAAVKAFQSIWGLMEKAAQTDEAMASLDALTRQYGMTAQDLVGKIEQESKGLIGMGAAAKVAGDALMKGLGPGQLAQIASWSVSLSHIRAGTVSTADAFEMLSQSIATGRERGLKALVGIVDLDIAGELVDRVALAHDLHQLLLDEPGGIPFDIELPGKLQRGNVVLGGGHQVHGEEPLGQRRARLVEDGSGPSRRLQPAIRALEQPFRRAIAVRPPGAGTPTARRPHTAPRS